MPLPTGEQPALLLNTAHRNCQSPSVPTRQHPAEPVTACVPLCLSPPLSLIDTIFTETQESPQVTDFYRSSQNLNKQHNKGVVENSSTLFIGHLKKTLELEQKFSRLRNGLITYSRSAPLQL